jgi:hypothetical protein
MLPLGLIRIQRNNISCNSKKGMDKRGKRQPIIEYQNENNDVK